MSSNKKIFVKIISCIFALTLMASCKSASKKSNDDETQSNESPSSTSGATTTPGSPPDREAIASITEEYARWRSQVVSNPEYELSLSLSESEKEFTGTETIEFKINGKPHDVALDFTKGTILNLVVNGQSQKPKYDDYSITLPAAALTEGPNSVAISFSHEYSKTGVGLARFKDPEDGSVYTYTDFEPFNANLMFPCFDQPDLKGVYTLKVEAPSAWTIISAALETSRDTVAPGRAQWIFPKTAPFSTYLISLHGGPYKMWTSQAGSIPLRLFARKSLAKYVNYNEWFKITKQGLEFYQRFFDTPYPFKKYDQVLVPDFNAGAMENVAAVTFTESYITRGIPTLEDRERLASTTLHEMAHMWFGDLVTMKWWSDLWLNESFATFMSALALEKNTMFKKSWQSFFVAEKTWAYWSDQLVVTHPVTTKVPSTDQAFANFDGITYGKGASVLKQLRFFVGENEFQKGVSNYIHLHALGNATVKDFIGAIETSSHKNLQGWTKQWLETSGVNSVEAQYSCDKGKLTKFSLVQTAPDDHPLLRDHRTRVALLGEKNSTLKVINDTPVSYNNPTSVADFISKPCPEAVYPNYGDEDFVKPILDPRTLDTVQTKLQIVGDSFLRMMIWDSLWEMVRDGKVPVQQYLSLVFKNLGTEADYKNLNFVLNTLHGRGRDASTSVIYYLPDDKNFREGQVKLIETFVWDHLQSAAPGSDFQKRWFDAYVKVAESSLAIERLKEILTGTIALPDLPVDQDRRWAIIVRINSFDPKEGADLEASELGKDKSNAGLLMSIAAEAARPTSAEKEKWIDKILHDREIPQSHLKAAMAALFPITQADSRKDFSTRFFKNLHDIGKKEEGHFQERFVELAPIMCDEGSVGKLEDYINSKPDLPPTMIKELKITHQEDQRCLAIRNKARQAMADHK